MILRDHYSEACSLTLNFPFRPVFPRRFGRGRYLSPAFCLFRIKTLRGQYSENCLLFHPLRPFRSSFLLLPRRFGRDRHLSPAFCLFRIKTLRGQYSENSLLSHPLRPFRTSFLLLPRRFGRTGIYHRPFAFSA